MADTTTKSATKRTVVRLTAEQKRVKAVEDVESQLAKAAVALINAAQGYSFAGDMGRARKCLTVWEQIQGVIVPDHERDNGEVVTN